jgi:hypothetical protein
LSECEIQIYYVSNLRQQRKPQLLFYFGDCPNVDGSRDIWTPSVAGVFPENHVFREHSLPVLHNNRLIM